MKNCVVGMLLTCPIRSSTVIDFIVKNIIIRSMSIVVHSYSLAMEVYGFLVKLT